MVTERLRLILMSSELENLIKELEKIHADIKQLTTDLKALIKSKHEIEAEIRLLKK